MRVQLQLGSFALFSIVTTDFTPKLVETAHALSPKITNSVLSATGIIIPEPTPTRIIPYKLFGFDCDVVVVLYL